MMKHIFALACAIYLLTFSPYLLASQTLIIGPGYHGTDYMLVGPAFKSIAAKPATMEKL